VTQFLPQHSLHSASRDEDAAQLHPQTTGDFGATPALDGQKYKRLPRFWFHAKLHACDGVLQ
jgi:hypothetical protein